MIDVEITAMTLVNQGYKTSHSVTLEKVIKAPRLQMDPIQTLESRYDQTSAVATIVGILQALETIPCTAWIHIRVVEGAAYTDGVIEVLREYKNLMTRIVDEIESRIKTFAMSYPGSLFSVEYDQDLQPEDKDDKLDYKVI